MTDEMSKTIKGNYFGWFLIVCGLLTVIPAAIIFILGFSTVSGNADKRALDFAQASQFHEAASYNKTSL